MASRRSAPAQRSMTRSRKILALVPKCGAKSDVESSESSEDEFQMCRPHQDVSEDSSPVRSIASSVENVNISDSDDCEYREIYAVASVHEEPRFGHNTTDSIPYSPSILQHDPDIIPPSPSVYIPPSPSIDSICSPASSAPTASSAPAAPSAPATAATVRLRRYKKTPVIVKKTILKPIKMSVKWTRTKFQGSADIEDNMFFNSTDIEKSPLDYFNLFFTDDILELIVYHSNLYSVQKKGTSINITKDDIKDFIAINILMGVVDMPAYTDYWSNDFKYQRISDVMTLKKFQLIRRYIHFNDNLKDDGDRYYKIRPLVEKVRRNYASNIPEGKRFSIDEMMVPYKGTRAGSRKQYVRNKPKKWGFKFFVRASPSGLVHDFIIYGGEDTFRHHTFSEKEKGMGLGAKVVIALAKSIKQKPCSVLYFDNFFTSIELMHHLRNEYGIFSLGTVRTNRLRGAEKKLPSDKELKKKGRGAFAQVVSNEHNIAVVKWFDNKFVVAASTYVDAHPVQNIMRYKKEEKKKGLVTCPNLIKHYNGNMGGVDLADMLVALYRTDLKGHRWYLVLFSQILDICVNNAWLLYRHENSSKPKLLPLKKFRVALFRQLRFFERSSDLQPDTLSKSVKKIKKPVAERPDDVTRYDLMGHLPAFTTKGRCRLCTKHQTKFFCSKCNARLCIVEGRNCFTDFHTK
ncbi:piggyBac transposable element-derived protein 3-like [Trichoplusia ni]|uniref:PiggyBac transposable element-derived protein 3-like n=1 Tax=Trichoplusia ni TaxID=7111 RepID=A0A7E5X1X3_TRINI|nr:piggyBac transposable element-derived protein 3-like [Trichoplusia ni]